jgi:hypothetical protein
MTEIHINPDHVGEQRSVDPDDDVGASRRAGQIDKRRAPSEGDAQERPDLQFSDTLYWRNQKKRSYQKAHSHDRTSDTSIARRI